MYVTVWDVQNFDQFRCENCFPVTFFTRKAANNRNFTLSDLFFKCLPNNNILTRAILIFTLSCQALSQSLYC